MGYSCSVKAHDTLRMTLNAVNNEKLTNYSFSNTWEHNGNKFFYERGREQSDGSVTGNIYKFLGETQCIKFGSLKILSNGYLQQKTILSF